MHLSYSPESVLRILHIVGKITRYNDFHNKFGRSMKSKGRCQFLCHQSCRQNALNFVFLSSGNNKFTSMPDFSKCCNSFSHHRTVTSRTGSLGSWRDTQIVSIYHIVKHCIQGVLFTILTILLLTLRGTFCFVNIFFKVYKRNYYISLN